MTTRHLLPIVLAGMIATWSWVPATPARPSALPLSVRSAFTLPSFLTPRVVRPPAKPGLPPMAFFVASGRPDACGPGCDSWIAAEGSIDFNAARRLRKVLAKLGSRKLPLYLNSAGGSVLGAIELGRLIRSHDLTVSIARTIPADCQHGDGHDRACEMLKRSRQDLAGELESSGAMCNSACVLVLAGGAQRSVPPWVKLGVHAIGVDAGKAAIRGPQLAKITRSANARIVEFLHDMGIPRALFDASNAVPHESARFLERDELVRFGLDTRNFGETDWWFTEKPYAAVGKGFFVHTGEAGLAYSEAFLRLNCGFGNSMRLTFAREHPAPDASPRPLRLTVSGTRIDLPSAIQSGNAEIWAGTLWADALASTDDKGAFEVSGFDDVPGGDIPGSNVAEGRASHGNVAEGKVPDVKTPNSRPPRPVVLTMTGFSGAYAKLRKVCSEAASAFNGCSAEDVSPHCMPDAMKTWRPLSDGHSAWPAK